MQRSKRVPSLRSRKGAEPQEAQIWGRGGKTAPEWCQALAHLEGTDEGGQDLLLCLLTSRKQLRSGAELLGVPGGAGGGGHGLCPLRGL